MKKIENLNDYLQMKEESKSLQTEREISAFIKKYRFLPKGMIDMLQAKLDAINAENRQSGIGGIHIIETQHDDQAQLSRLRTEARRQGFTIKKSRGKRTIDNLGGYCVIDQNNCIVAGERFDLVPDEVEKYLLAGRQ